MKSKNPFPIHLVIFAALFAAPAASGCTYWKDRALDASDIIIAEAHWGYGFGTEIRVFEFLGISAGYCKGKHTLPDFREDFNFEHGYKMWSFLLFGVCDDDPVEEKNRKKENEEDAQGDRLGIGLGKLMDVIDQFADKRFYFGPFADRLYWCYDYPHYHRFGDVSVLLYLVAPGFKIGISPGEFADFLLGFTTLDIGDDDSEATARKKAQRTGLVYNTKAQDP